MAAVGIAAIAGPLVAQDVTQGSNPESRVLFPHDFIRGYAGFELAPPHNEPDLGLCAPTSSASSPCGGYARYVLTAYMELQPFGRGMLRNIYLFTDPRMFLGNNVPQLRYSASSSPIAWERVYGIAIQLPKRFEIRATHHDVQLLGKYRSPLNITQSANGPLGLYSTVGVRWYFGSYGSAGVHQ